MSISNREDPLALRLRVQKNLISTPNDPKVVSRYAVLTLDFDVSDSGIRYLEWLKILCPQESFVRLALLCATHRRRGPGSASAMARCFKNDGQAGAVDTYLAKADRLANADFPFAVPARQSAFDRSGHWRRVWGADDFGDGERGPRSLRALEVYDGELYCGFSDDLAAKHSVQKWDGEKWSLVADEQTWRKFGYDGANTIGSFCSMNGKLYATVSIQKTGPMSGDVFSYDGDSWNNISQGLQKWRQVGERALNPMIVHENRLYVGGYVGRGRQEPLAIYCFNGDTWEREILRDPSLGLDFTASEVYEFVEYRGTLYAATSGYKLGSGTVWRLTTSGWEMVGGLGVRDSWGVKTTIYIEALAVFQDRLIVSFGPSNEQFRLLEILPAIWMFDGERWEPLVAREDSGVMARSLNYNHLFVHCDRLLAATGSTPSSLPSEVAIWELDVARREWKRRAGAGINDSWNDTALAFQNDRNAVWVYRMIAYQDDFYAAISFGSGGGAAELWRHGNS